MVGTSNLGSWNGQLSTTEREMVILSIQQFPTSQFWGPNQVNPYHSLPFHINLVVVVKKLSFSDLDPL